MKKHAERDHSLLSPSKSERWLNCPASVELEKDAPEQKPTPQSIEGVKAHECLEKALRTFFKNGRRADFSKSGLKDPWAVEIAFNYVVDRWLENKKVDVLLEEKVDTSKVIHPDCSGSLDISLSEPFGLLEVIDYKNGTDPVDASMNTQMMIYAIGVCEKYGWDFESVRMTIIQPRVRDNSDQIKSWEISVRELRRQKDVIKKGAYRAMKTGHKPFPGKWCKYCAASLTCPTASKALTTVHKNATVEGVVLPDFKKLNGKQLSEVLTAIQKIKLWANDVENFAEDKVKNGMKIPGWDMIPKRAYRVWKDQEKAIKVFGPIVREVFNTTLKSPAQMEKEKPLKKCDIKKLVEEHSQSVSSGTRFGQTNKFLEF